MAWGFLLLSLPAFAQSLETKPTSLFNPEGPLQLEVLIAGSSLHDVSSAFGHMALRIQYRDTKRGPQDLVLNFAAHDQNETGLKQKAKGLIGAYPTLLLFEDFKYYVKRNIITDNRIVRRLVLPVNAEIRQNLFQVLESVVAGRIHYENYLFLTRNCASSLYGFLGQIGFFTNENFSFPLAPVQYASVLLHPVLLGIIELPSLQSANDAVARLESKYDFNLRDEKNVRVENLLNRIQEVPSGDLQILLSFDLSNFSGLRIAILKELKRRGQTKLTSADSLLGNRDYPAILYALCEQADCAANQAQEMKKIYGSQLKHYVSFLRNEINRSEQLIFGQALQKTAQYKQARLLLQALQLELTQK